MANKFTFHENTKNPGDLHLISHVYIHKDVIKGFEDRRCANIFTSTSKEFLYGFDENNTIWRCDSIYSR